jgi:hypothetical protein
MVCVNGFSWRKSKKSFARGGSLMGTMSVHVEYRISAPVGTKKNGFYIPYEEEEKRRMGKPARGFYWASAECVELPGIPENETDLRVILDAMEKLELPSDSELAEGHKYEALKAKIAFGSRDFREGESSRSSIELEHYYSKESLVDKGRHT